MHVGSRIREISVIKIIMQGKIIAWLRILFVHIETSSFWAEFVNKNIDASVFVSYPWRIKAFNIDNFDNSHNSFIWPEYFIDFYVKDGFHVRL